MIKGREVSLEAGKVQDQFRCGSYTCKADADTKSGISCEPCGDEIAQLWKAGIAGLALLAM